MLDLQGAWAILDEGVAAGAFPGASAVVASAEGVLGAYTVGRYTYEPDSLAVTARTRYDLASVSKTFTATAVMSLVEEGRLDLTTPVREWLPELKSAEQAGITLRHLLTHSGGIVSRADWHVLYPTADALWQAFFAAPLAFLPGLSTLYTSAGFMLLGLVVERVSGKPLDRYLTDRVFGPLGMTESGFCPPPDARHACAPTEYSPERSRLLQGEVHDENAGLIGGVCGHTGIFATAGNVAAFGRMLAGGGSLDGVHVLKPDTVRKMLVTDGPAGWPGWSLGFMQGNPAFGNPAGGFTGHTGFTGTSVAVAPTRGITAVLLTNRVFPTRQNNRIAAVRARFHDAVAAATREAQS